MPTVTAAIVSHNRLDQLKNMVWQLENQTEPFDVIKIYISGYKKDEIEEIKSWGYQVSIERDKKDWGHEKRAKAIEECTTDYILCASDDDLYTYHFLDAVKREMEKHPDADIYATDFRTQREFHTHSYGYKTAEPKLGEVTNGCLVIKAEKARDVGYNHRDFGADGRFVEDMVGEGADFRRVPYFLFFHY